MRVVVACLVVSFLLAACASSTPDPALLQTSVAGTLAAMPTDTSIPTVTATQTELPSPTFTREPTSTPRPSQTSEPTPTSYSLVTDGMGDAVIDIDKERGPMLVTLVHMAKGNFAVWSLDANGEKINLLVNTIGDYHGIRPLDFLDGEQTARLQIITDPGNPWHVFVFPLDTIERINVPGNYAGSGDNVIFLDGGTPDLLKVYAPKSTGNFAIKGYGDTVELLVNEMAPYTGVVPLDKETGILEIMATGDWVIQVTEK